MHPSLSMEDILNLLARELVESELKATAVSLACCRRSFEEPVLRVLWEKQDRLTPLLKCLPQEVWEGADGSFCFQRIPTKAEWTHLQKRARRMRKLKLNTEEGSTISGTLPVLQLRAANEPFLPGLKSFECDTATTNFLPLIPFFLSPRTTEISIEFAEDPLTVAVASIFNMLPTLCPNLKRVTTNVLERDTVITDAVSEMLLACNRDSLEGFLIDSRLTEEAREVVYRLPNLSELWTVIEGRTLLPQVALPNLTEIDVEYDDHLDWLQGFHGATFGRLKTASFRSESEQIGDFLGAFESVALTTSVQNTLSEFGFYTSRPWNPDYSRLLSFKQLLKLEIEFACHGGCSSTVDDDAIITLAQAMPKLEILRLGCKPCKTPTGATIRGLIALASCCLHLSKLRIHFRGDSLVRVTVRAATTSPLTNGPVVQREDCALTDLDVGDIPIPPRSAAKVTLALVQIFPRITNVEFTDPEWATVVENVGHYKRIGAFIRLEDEAHPVPLDNP